jgi:DNA end-binding protein Ku
MARAVWSGTVSFGLVNVPVKAFTAVRDHDVHFHRVVEGTATRVRNKQVNEETGREVPSEKIEMGYELDSGNYVTFDPKEIEDLRPRSTRSIEVSDFVPLVEIDPMFYERTYWLAPDGDEAEAAYGLLLAAMVDQERVAIGTVVMRTKQYLAAVRPVEGALAMSTMRFADEVVDRSTIDAIPKKVAEPTPKQLKLATQFIDALAADWDPERYRDDFTEELRDIIKRKAKGEEIEVQEAVQPGGEAEVVDLMEVLQASVDAARKGGRVKSRKASSSRPASKRTASGSSRAKGSGGSRRASGSKRSSGSKAASSGSRRKSA